MSNLGQQNTESESDDDSYCPALPPHLLKNNVSSTTSEPKILGPTLPPSFKAHQTHDTDSEEDDECIGPMPPKGPIDEDHQIKEFERRAKKMKQKLLESKEEKPLVREDWMLSLPDEKSKLEIFGMAPRTFAKKTKEPKGDTSAWTDTPADKERKRQEKEMMKDAPRKPEKPKDHKKSLEEKVTSERDEKYSKYVEEYNKKRRGESLVEMHQKKQKKEEPLIVTRRPFSREEDLNVNKFDAAQKAAIMKKAHQLGDRFSSGEKSFL